MPRRFSLPRPLRSIRWRLQLWYGLLIGALLMGFGVSTYHLERGVRLDRIDDELQRIAFAINAVNRAPPPRADRDDPQEGKAPKPLDEVFTAKQLANGFYYGVWTRNRVPFVASPNAPAKLPKPPDSAPTVRWRGRLREAYLSTNPGDISLVGRDVSAELEALHAFGWRVAGWGIAAFVVTLLIGSWLVTRALRPIHDISDAATKIATGDLAQRIDARDPESELGQLAVVLNSTFARLEAAFAQQGRFTADAAHELRTPVTVILTHAQNALATENLSAEQRESLEAVQRAAQRMRRIIESLLRLARIDAGEEARRNVPLDLAAIARDAVELVRPLAEQRRISVRATLHPAASRGDMEGCGQVITNLLSNAVHHNREGGEIHVSTHADDNHAVLVVADNGPGIPPEHLPHIFKRFYRADKARTTHQGRTGLGLAIVKAIVEAHGGEIEAQSQAGSGATFTVRLPALD